MLPRLAPFPRLSPQQVLASPDHATVSLPPEALRGLIMDEADMPVQPRETTDRMQTRPDKVERPVSIRKARQLEVMNEQVLALR